MSDKLFEHSKIDSPEQLGNFLEKDFGKEMKRQIKENIKDAPLHATEMDDIGKMRFLKMAIDFLDRKGKEALYRKILLCRAAGATYEQMARSCKCKPDNIRAVERDAIKCVKDKINTRKVLPFVNRKRILVP